MFGSCNAKHVKLPEYAIHNILPRDSFVKVEIKIEVTKCFDEENCFTQKFVGHGSGAVVRNTNKGSYILTAGHVCEEKDFEKEAIDSGLKFKMNFEIVDIDNLRYAGSVKKIDNKLDTCIMFVKHLAKPSIKLRNSELEIGKKYYNIAAPAAIFGENMIPILEGRYSGFWEEIGPGFAVYTIPAIGGSSGSPIVNEDGELVGMIHSVHAHFPFVSFSPSTDQLYDFLKDVIK
tara:strand:+ start:1572 stop:2267 length:696 start_codon:yes stop_codon:yes gene_type:complete